MSDKAKVDFNDFVENYNTLLGDETRFFSADEAYFAQYKIDIVKKNIMHPVNRLLEYGCGIGRNIPFLKKAFPQADVMGSDISAASLKRATAENPDTEFFQEGVVGALNDTFDLIFVAGVFHHIPSSERAAVCRTLKKRLSSSGQVIIFEHNPFNPITRRIVSRCPYDKDAVLLKPTDMRKLLWEANLSVTRQAYCLFFPPMLGKLIRLERYLGWFPLGGQYWVQAV